MTLREEVEIMRKRVKALDAEATVNALMLRSLYGKVEFLRYVAQVELDYDRADCADYQLKHAPEIQKRFYADIKGFERDILRIKG